MEWEQNAEGGTLAWFALDLQRPAMGPHHAQHRREAQAASDEFGGEKWIQDLRLSLRRHATSRINDFEDHKMALGDFGCGGVERLQAGGIDLGHASVDGD